MKRAPIGSPDAFGTAPIPDVLVAVQVEVLEAAQDVTAGERFDGGPSWSLTPARATGAVLEVMRARGILLPASRIADVVAELLAAHRAGEG